MNAQYFIAPDLHVAELSTTERRFAARSIAKKIFVTKHNHSERNPGRKPGTYRSRVGCVPIWRSYCPKNREYASGSSRVRRDR